MYCRIDPTTIDMYYIAITTTTRFAPIYQQQCYSNTVLQQKCLKNMFKFKKDECRVVGVVIVAN